MAHSGYWERGTETPCQVTRTLCSEPARPGHDRAVTLDTLFTREGSCCQYKEADQAMKASGVPKRVLQYLVRLIPELFSKLRV